MSQVVRAVRTGGGLSRDAWVRSRHGAAYNVLLDRGLEPSLAWWVAATLVAQWVRETGGGRNEWGCSEGNIRATASWDGAVQYLQGGDDATEAPYRAYPTEPNCETGVADAIRLAIDGRLYHPAYLRLLASANGGPYAVGASRQYAVPIDSVQWYANVMRAGWNPYTQAGLDEYRSIAGTVAGIVGAPPYVSSTFGKVAVGAGVAAFGMALFVVLRGRR